MKPVILATWDFGALLCRTGQRSFAAGADLLDALETGVRAVEDDPRVHSVGYGGLPNQAGVVQLDAAMMDGRTHRAGAVAALERIRNPITVARAVMEQTEHVLLVGAGALAFARSLGLREQNLLTAEARALWKQRESRFDRRKEQEHDTVCGLALDGAGHLGGAVSTSGLAKKMPGRVGDSPIIGAGLYVDGEVGAAAATGIGELAQRTCASAAVVERMRAGASPTSACRQVLGYLLEKIPAVRRDRTLQLALIALDRKGRVGSAVLRPGRPGFRYALCRGTGKPRLLAVRPLLDR